MEGLRIAAPLRRRYNDDSDSDEEIWEVNINNLEIPLGNTERPSSNLRWTMKRKNARKNARKSPHKSPRKNTRKNNVRKNTNKNRNANHNAKRSKRANND